MHQKWIHDRKNTYNYPRFPRARGDWESLEECEKHRGIIQMVKNEKKNEKEVLFMTILKVY
jgi:hypothetical protein